MAETSIKISLELADKAAQKALGDFISKSGSADKSLKKLKDSGSGTFSEISVGIGKAIGAYDIFTGNLAANVAVKSFEVVAEAAHKLFDTFIVDGVKSAIQTQDAINALNVALAQNGNYSEQAAKDFIDYADQIQKTTTYSDDQALSTAALLESLGSLDKDGLKRATTATLNLASALRIDLNAAAVLVGKAATGEISSFTRYGLVIERGSSAAETFANVLKVIEGRFNGTAASKLNTYSGAVTFAKNAFDDFVKSIGNFIIENPAVVATIKESAVIFSEWGDSTRNASNALTNVGKGISIFLGAAAFLVTGIDVVVRVFQTLYGVLQAASVPFLAITVPLRALSVGFSQATKEAAEFGQSTLKNLKALGDSGDGALAGMAQDLLRLKDSADKGLLAVAAGAKAVVDPINNTTAGVKALDDATKAAQSRLKSFIDGLVKQGESAKSVADQQVQAAQAKADAELVVQQDLLDKKLINESQFQEAKTAIDQQFEVAKQKAIEDQFLADQQRLQLALDLKLASQADYQKAYDQLVKNHNIAEKKLNIDKAKQEQKDREASLSAEEKLQAAKLSAVSNTFGALSSLMRTSSKELFAIGKAASIAQATINTYEAVTKTMASVPYPFNIPLAIAQSIAGFVQVSNIAKTNPSFEQGGIVPGTSFSGDRLTANVNSGEMILNRGQQATLFKMANGESGAGNSSRIETLLSAIYQAILETPVQVNVGGKTIVDVLRSELRSGRAFA